MPYQVTMLLQLLQLNRCLHDAPVLQAVQRLKDVVTKHTSGNFKGCSSRAA